MKLYQGPKVKTPLRQFERPQPGSQYSAAERKAWGATQDRARAARAAQASQGTSEPKATPAKRATRSKILEADCSGSVCFDELVYQDGTVTATFAKDSSTYEYDMSLSEAKEWFDDDLGEYFNAEIR